MRLAVFAATALAFVPTAAFAQADPAPPDCDLVGGAGAPREGDAIAVPPGGGTPFFVSPPANLANVPRNLQIVLGGDLSGLDVDPPLFTLDLADVSGARLPLVRDGGRFSAATPLAARESYLVTLAPSAAHPCPDCVGIQQLGFSTGDEIDITPPSLEGAPPVSVYVMPSPEQAAQCGFFFGTTHNIVVDFGSGLPLNTFLSVAAKKDGDVPHLLFDQFNAGTAFQATGNVGTQVPVGLGDAFTIAFTPRDLAGNRGDARVVRVRARTFTDQGRPPEDLAPLWCDMPDAPVVRVPAELPTNGQLEVDFPFEEVPLALRPQGGGDDVPLVPVIETDLGNVYGTAVPLPPGARFDVVGLACPHCICEGCTRFSPQPITVGDRADTEAPAAPVVVVVGEDAAPAVAAEEQCHPDRPALIVVIEAGQDETAGPLDLRYDASIRLQDGPPRVLATAASPLLRADGNVVLRVETRDFGRVLGGDFEITLTAMDAAGNRSAPLVHREVAATSGCGATQAAAPGALFALAVLLGRRPRVKRV